MGIPINLRVVDIEQLKVLLLGACIRQSNGSEIIQEVYILKTCPLPRWSKLLCMDLRILIQV